MPSILIIQTISALYYRTIAVMTHPIEGLFLMTDHHRFKGVIR